MIISFLVCGDFVFCFIATIIDTSNYEGNKAIFFFIHFLLFVPLLIIVIILLLKKRKKQLIAGGYTYLIGGIFIWATKLIYFLYLFLSDSLDEDYKEAYSNSIYLVTFILNLLVIFFRVGACHIAKGMYPYILKLEEFEYKKEQAEFIQSLGTKGENEARLCDDEEEITRDKLLNNKNNPFITGREKKEDNEEEEFCFQTTL